MPLVYYIDKTTPLLTIIVSFKGHVIIQEFVTWYFVLVLISYKKWWSTCKHFLCYLGHKVIEKFNHDSCNCVLVKFSFSEKASKICLIFLVVLSFTMPFTGRKMFCAGPYFMSQPKNWLHLGPLQKLLCRHKNHFYWMQIIFLSGAKYLWMPQYVNRFLV